MIDLNNTPFNNINEVCSSLAKCINDFDLLTLSKYNLTDNFRNRDINIKELLQRTRTLNNVMVDNQNNRNDMIADYYRYPLESLYRMGNLPYTFVGIMDGRNRKSIYISNVHWSFSTYVTNHIVVNKSQVDEKIWELLWTIKQKQMFYFTGYIVPYIRIDKSGDYGIKIISIDKIIPETDVNSEIPVLIRNINLIDKDRIDISRPIEMNEINCNILINAFISKINSSDLFISLPDIFSVNFCYNMIYCRQIDNILDHNNPMLLHYKTQDKTKIFVYGALSFLSSYCNIHSSLLIHGLIYKLFEYYILNHSTDEEIDTIVDNMCNYDIYSFKTYLRVMKEDFRRCIKIKIPDEFIKNLYIIIDYYINVQMRVIL